MTHNQFQIIYTGKFKSNLDIVSTAAQFALIIKSSPEFALKTLKSNNEVILFDNVSHSRSLSLISNLEKIGLVVTSIDKTNNPQTVQPNKNKHSKSDLIGHFKKISGAYKKLLLIYSIISTGILIIFLSYLFISSQYEPYGRITLTDFAGYAQHEICLGSNYCNEVVDDQSDYCYETTLNDFEGWSELSEEGKDLANTKSINNFVNCFVYPETNNKVFPEPIALRTDLIESCLYLPTQACLLAAGTQFDYCVEAFNMKALFVNNYQNIELLKSNNPEIFKSYYYCYLDANDSSLFESILFILVGV